ncbi:hypothetical protein MLD38_012916 [Melastoma candidum]|uniref:Uncharacterized protein n=1 Tax=Melastoma candidum TaxID=119954 RepID=A0ACB9RAZ4_9MYRT|nr:hypothetical protein MLD38_012916 [Melastoma candidum]
MGKGKKRQRTKEVSSVAADTTTSPALIAGDEEFGQGISSSIQQPITPRKKRGRPRKVVVDKEAEDKEVAKQVLEGGGGGDKGVGGGGGGKNSRINKKKKPRSEDDQQQIKHEEEDSSSRMTTRSRSRKKSTPRKSS